MDMLVITMAMMYIFVPALLLAILVGYSSEAFVGLMAVFLYAGAIFNIFGDFTIDSTFMIIAILMSAVFLWQAVFRSSPQ
jgi:hypothetical protein